MVDGKSDWVFEVVFDAGAKQSVDEEAMDVFLQMEFVEFVFGCDFDDVDVFADLFVMMFCGVREFFFVAEEEDDCGVFF